MRGRTRKADIAVSTPSLFPSDAKRRFTTTTADRFRHMSERYAKKKLPPPPFTLAQLRQHISDAIVDGAFRCRYCNRVCDISEVALDHATPIIRGGSLGLDNIEIPCAGCNSAKGELTAAEFAALMDFLERVIPFARTDVLDRLAKYGKLVSAKRKADMLLRNQGQFPKASKKVKPPLVRQIEEAF